MPPQPEQPHPDINWTIKSDLPQISPNRLNEPDGIVVIGRCAGPLRDKAIHALSTLCQSEKVTVFPSSVQTQFALVRVIATGELRIERYNPEQHGYWPDLPDVEETPPQLLEQVKGFGDGIIPISQQFQKERKAPGGASRKYTPVSHHPKPRKPR